MYKMTLRYYIDPELKNKGSNLLQPQHGDAGYDICTPEDFILAGTHNEPKIEWFDRHGLETGSILNENISVVKINTGIHVEIPEGFVGVVANKSSVGVGKSWEKDGKAYHKWGGIIVLGGIIDSSYRGPMQLAFANVSAKTAHFKAGDKVAQLILMKYNAPQLEELNSLTDLSQTQRGSKGFGSTGEKA